jgi:hypothetical protein
MKTSCKDDKPFSVKGKAKIKMSEFTIPIKTKIKDTELFFDHTDKYFTAFHEIGDYLISVFPPHSGDVVKGNIGIDYVDCQTELRPNGMCECPSGVHSHLRIKRENANKHIDLVLRFINKKTSEHTFMTIGTCGAELWKIYRLPIKLKE